MIASPEEFLKSSERNAQKLAELNIKLGEYPFETCSECESKVFELLKSIHWRVAVSSVYPIELDEYAEKLQSRTAELYDELDQHRKEAQHGPRLSQTEILVEKLLKILENSES